MSRTLFYNLIRTSLTESGADYIANVRQRLGSATEFEWERSLADLKLHRLLPFVWYGLKMHNLIDTIPHDYFLAEMRDSYQATLIKNIYFLQTLEKIAKVMQEYDVHPVVWKGILLIDSFYPDPGMRSMWDIDFAISSEEIEQTTTAFKSLGFVEQADMRTSDAIYFVNQMMVPCDVHHRVRLFEDKKSINLTVELKPERTKAPTLTVLEPNAMLVHLVVHMNGHYYEMGPMLSWILDLVFLLRKWGDLIDLKRLEELMPAQEHFASLFRTLRFLESELGEKLPKCLTEAAKSFEPLTLEEILRQRRLAVWGLSSPRGWLRLAACRLGWRPTRSRSYPHWSDLLTWPTDIARNKRMGISLGKKYDY